MLLLFKIEVFSKDYRINIDFIIHYNINGAKQKKTMFKKGILIILKLCG